MFSPRKKYTMLMNKRTLVTLAVFVAVIVIVWIGIQHLPIRPTVESLKSKAANTTTFPDIAAFAASGTDSSCTIPSACEDFRGYSCRRGAIRIIASLCYGQQEGTCDDEKNDLFECNKQGGDCSDEFDVYSECMQDYKSSEAGQRCLAKTKNRTAAEYTQAKAKYNYASCNKAISDLAKQQPAYQPIDGKAVLKCIDDTYADSQKASSICGDWFRNYGRRDCPNAIAAYCQNLLDKNPPSSACNFKRVENVITGCSWASCFSEQYAKGRAQAGAVTPLQDRQIRLEAYHQCLGIDVSNFQATCDMVCTTDF